MDYVSKGASNTYTTVIGMPNAPSPPKVAPQMARILTNCPNCGAPLRHDGYCEYCDSKIRYENEIDILSGDLTRGAEIEILLKISDDKVTRLIPLIGHISSIKVQANRETLYYDNTPYFITTNSPEYEIVFNAHLSDRKFSVGSE